MSNAVYCTVIASVAGTIVLCGCTRRQPSPPPTNASISAPVAAADPRPPTAERCPAALVEIGKSAAVVFDHARTLQWGEASATGQALYESAATLSVGALQPDLAARLKSRVAYLRSSVKAADRVRSMDAANSITHVVAELCSPYQDEIPYKIVLLDYYGRQLELGLVASRPSTIKRATADLRQTWRSVERAVLQHGDVDDARRFTDIVVQIEGARRPADLVAPMRAELAEVDRLKKIFTP